MFVIRNAQLDALQEPVLAEFEANMLPHLQRYFPIDSALLGEAQLRRVIHDGVRAALGLAFEDQSQVCRYINLSLSLGIEFTKDPLLPWAAACIAEGMGKPETFERLHDAAMSHIEVVSGEDGGYAMRAILKARSLPFAEVAREDADHGESTLRLLRKLWPQKYRRLSATDRHRFLALADKLSLAEGLSAPGPRQVYTMLMFLLGSYFARDATIPWAREALDLDRGNDPLARARALHDAGMAHVETFLSLLPSQVEA